MLQIIEPSQKYAYASKTLEEKNSAQEESEEGSQWFPEGGNVEGDQRKPLI